jgi:hypothetical protein
MTIINLLEKNFDKVLLKDNNNPYICEIQNILKFFTIRRDTTKEVDFYLYKKLEYCFNNLEMIPN